MHFSYISERSQMSMQASGLVHPYIRISGLFPVDISAYPGTALAICGSNGAGKTTFLKLLLKEIEPKKQPQLYSNVTKKSFWDPDMKKRTNIDKKLVEKEFERANEDFINTLVISKKASKS